VTIREICNDVTDIGEGCFITNDRLVIGYKGLNFYQACDHRVKKHKLGGYSHCVKRKGHPSLKHEDFDGNLRGGTEMLRFFGWWNPKNEKEEWYSQGWNNGAITSMVLMVLISATLIVLML
jgi:hypothetical protein